MQCGIVNHLKQQAGWVDTVTPPPGQILNSQGYAVQSSSILPANFTPLPPPPPPGPPNTPVVPNQIEIQPGQAGAAFVNHSDVQCVESAPCDNNSVTGTIATVFINGQPSNQPLYDRNGTIIT